MVWEHNTVVHFTGNTNPWTSVGTHSGWAYCDQGEKIEPLPWVVLTKPDCLADASFCFNRFQDTVTVNSSYDPVAEALDIDIDMIPDAFDSPDTTWAQENFSKADAAVPNDLHLKDEDWSCPGKQHEFGVDGQPSGCL